MHSRGGTDKRVGGGAYQCTRRWTELVPLVSGTCPRVQWPRIRAGLWTVDGAKPPELAGQTSFASKEPVFWVGV